MNRLKYIAIALAIALTACGEGGEDNMMGREPAIPLPPIQNVDDVNGAVQGTAMLKVPEAIERSSLVFSGSILEIDSMIHGRRAPFSLVGVRLTRVWKGESVAGSTVYYITRKQPAFDKGTEQVFFLSPVDSTSGAAYNSKLRWQWTNGAPAVLAKDTSVYLVRSDSLGYGLKRTEQ